MKSYEEAVVLKEAIIHFICNIKQAMGIYGRWSFSTSASF